MENLFSHDQIDLATLRQRSFNYRWAEQPEGVIPLTAADMDFPIASIITQRVQEYLAKGYMNYAPSSGLEAFKEAVAQHYYFSKNVPVNPDYVLPVNAAANGLYLAVKTYVKKGDKVLVPNPVDFLFKRSLQSVGAEVYEIKHIEGTANFDLNLLERAFERISCFMICNPNNPLGKCISKEHLQEIAALAVKHRVKIIADEVWADIDFDNQFLAIASINEAIRNQTIIVSGLSKNFGLAGFRIGYVIAFNEKDYQQLLGQSKHLDTINGVSSIAQIAGEAALNEAQDWKTAFVNHLNSNRLLIEDRLKEFPFLTSNRPNSTFTFFPAIDSGRFHEEKFCELALKEAKVALIPGGEQWFGSASKSHIRFTYATSQEMLNEAFDRLVKVFG